MAETEESTPKKVGKKLAEVQGRAAIAAEPKLTECGTSEVPSVINIDEPESSPAATEFRSKARDKVSS